MNKSKKPNYIRTSRPAKNLLFRWIKDDLKKIGRVQSIGDIGCAELAFYTWFDAEEYYAYDIDPQRPQRASESFDEAINVKELDITKYATDKKHDLIFCIQVMIGNLSFTMDSKKEAINNLINSTDFGGRIIFNIKASALEIDSIKTILMEKFENLSIKKYGEINFRIRYPLSRFTGLFLYFAHIIGFKGSGNRYYIFAENRLY